MTAARLLRAAVSSPFRLLITVTLLGALAFLGIGLGVWIVNAGPPGTFEGCPPAKQVRANGALVSCEH